MTPTAPTAPTTLTTLAPDPAAAEAELGRSVRRGLSWSALSSILLRTGSLLVGIVVARVLTPEQFGVFAIALTVQTLVMNLSDLGLGTQLIRSRDFERDAPTVASVGLISGLSLAGLMALCSGWIAVAMGSAEATSAIAVLAATIAVSGLGVVPLALLNRTFRQGDLLLVTAADFVIGTTLSLSLVLAADMGALGLALGRLLGQATATTMLFVVTKRRPRFGWERSRAAEAARFGAPVAGANVLSWTTLGVPTPVISHVAGVVPLSQYALAFNISSWPMSVLGQAVRAVALPAFSRLADEDPTPVVAQALRLAWGVAAPAGAALAVLAAPVITTVYGERWYDAWPALAALGVFGAIRVAFDLFASFLLVHGRSRAVLAVQLSWLVSVVPALVVGTTWGGILGAALAQLGVVVLVSGPMYLLALRRSGVVLGALLRALALPTAGTLAAAVVGGVVARLCPTDLTALIVGGVAGAIALHLVSGRRLLTEAGVGPWARRSAETDQAAAAPEKVTA